MTGPVTDEILSAVSLLVALLGVLFGVWYPELKSAQNIRVPVNPDARAPIIADVRGVFRWRAAPLLVASVVLVILILPIVVGVLVSAADVVRSAEGVRYDAVSALFLATYLILVGLVVVVGRETARLRATLSRIQPSSE